jgi:hypothetical protein
MVGKGWNAANYKKTLRSEWHFRLDRAGKNMILSAMNHLTQDRCKKENVFMHIFLLSSPFTR